MHHKVTEDSVSLSYNGRPIVIENKRERTLLTFRSY